MEINVIINKVSYNSSQHIPEEEDIKVEILSKFGVAKDDVLSRAFFFEVNINGIDLADGNMTRSLLLEASFQYKISKAESNEATEEDNTYHGKCLELLNEKVINFTSQDNRQPFNIQNAIDEFHKE